MPYCIFRFKKHHIGSVSPMYRHNERMKQSYESNPDIDPARRQNQLSSRPAPAELLQGDCAAREAQRMPSAR